MPVPDDHDASEQEHVDTPLELFFDLVFVFAVSQLSGHLLHHLSWRGAAETLVMLLTVLTVWSYTSWATTMVRDDQSQACGMVLAVMLLGLFMNASLTKAFTTSAWMFVIPLLTIQLGRTVWTIINATNAVNREQYVRVLLWFLATTPLWIAGAVVGAGPRLSWWVLAAGIELIGTWLAHPIPGRSLESENVAFDAEHMTERCRLFLLIALGETVLTTGTAIAVPVVAPMILVTGVFALVGSVALWSLIFGRSHQLIAGYVEETRDPIRASRYAVNVMMVTVAGLIAVAVANEMIITHPQGPNTIGLSLLLFGGPIIFLAAQGWYLWAMLHVSPRMQLVGGAVLALTGCAALLTPSFVALILAGIGLAILAIADCRHSANSTVHEPANESHE
jgi:low temperature requirement protein LtrA